MFPRPLITLFAVIAFGPWLGFVYSMTGILLAALVTYYVGVKLPRRHGAHGSRDRRWTGSRRCFAVAA